MGVSYGEWEAAEGSIVDADDSFDTMKGTSFAHYLQTIL